MKKIETSKLVLVVLAGARLAQAQTCPADYLVGPTKGKISRNFYRIPYVDGTTMTMGISGDYFGHNGSMDSHSIPTGGVLVAPADGVICVAEDSLNDCGCVPGDPPPAHPIGGCNNSLIIMHANGEFSAYIHMQQFSIRNAFGVSNPNALIGVSVQQGQMVALEGDVGRTCGSAPKRWGMCITQAEAASLTGCGSHVHWNIRRASNGELMQPMTCGIPGNIYATSVNYITVPCNTSLCTQTAQTLTNYIVDGYGQARVVQNADAITATSANICNGASAVFHAGNHVVRLLPGFKAGAGGGYFRAEIGPCSQTAPTP